MNFNQYEKDYYDVIVVGAGNAALSAAISARENGLDVLVLEKGPKTKRGGNSYFTDGAIRFAYKNLNDIRKIIPEISDEEADKIEMPEYNKDLYYEDIMKVNSNKSDSSLVKTLVNKSYETVKWMKENGVEFELNFSNQSFEKDQKSYFWGGLPVNTKNKGIGLIDNLLKRVGDLGIDIWYEAKAYRINQSDGEIKSLMIEKLDIKKSVEVKTKSVILASGGFEANREMREQHIGDEWGTAIVRGTEFNTGDGLNMAFEVGAQKNGNWAGCHSIGTDYNAPKVGDFDKPGDIFKKHSYPLGIMVNKLGHRFVDEGADYRNYTYAKYGREILKQPDGTAYQVFDDQVRSLLRKEYNLKEASSFSADTLEALSEKMDIDEKEFLKTIQEYNKSVQDGLFSPNEKDGKNTEGINPAKSNWALKLENSPFYAFPVTCGITFTFGGLLVSTSGEVLSTENNPINGLFAAGELVGGIFYDNYPGGSGLMSGAVYGKIAGESASKYLKSISIKQGGASDGKL